ncbi:M15 family metallopeptidase [Niveibacterium sp. SC-1]|uniref:M15 family metallopeptidase n=1 Tax=Niveibacterium sp. SC-1 TaxID=3135646 RepID=UPI00311DC3F2
MSLSPEELTGRAHTHVREFVTPGGKRFFAHPQAGTAFLSLCEEAARAGILLEPVAAFRDFGAQARIWSDKWNGRRPLYDAQGGVREYAALDETERVAAILEWSALPGASRHHWGSEFDVIDASALPENYRLRLMPDEYAKGGVFEHLGEWLPQHISSRGFFRPYDEERGGLHPEPWHLSFAAVAVPALAQFSATLLAEALADADLPGIALARERVADVYERQVLRVAQPGSPEPYSPLA